MKWVAGWSVGKRLVARVPIQTFEGRLDHSLHQPACSQQSSRVGQQIDCASQVDAACHIQLKGCPGCLAPVLIHPQRQPRLTGSCEVGHGPGRRQAGRRDAHTSV